MTPIKYKFSSNLCLIKFKQLSCFHRVFQPVLRTSYLLGRIIFFIYFRLLLCQVGRTQTTHRVGERSCVLPAMWVIRLHTLQAGLCYVYLRPFSP